MSNRGSNDNMNNNKKPKAAVAVTTDMTRRMICGGLAGMIAKTATNPLERIKMLSQTGEHGLIAAAATPTTTAAGTATAAATLSRSASMTMTSTSTTTRISILDLYRTILREEGIRGLWAGNGANLLRVFPAKAVVFSTNDMYRGMWRHMFHLSPSEPLSPLASFILGGFAGMTATVVTYPLDLARGRISGKLGQRRQASPRIGGGGGGGDAVQKAYSGIWQTMKLTVQDEGFMALYRGVLPTMLGAMPYEGIKFGTVGLLEALFPMSAATNHAGDQQQQQHASTPFRKLIFGGIGGMMASLITYPNDTVRRLLQMQGSRGTVAVYKGYWDCAAQTVQQHGIARLYHGLTINMIRMAPNAAVQFGSYELLKQWSEPYF